MKLHDDHELATTRRKLAELETLIARKQQRTTRGPAYELSLASMKRMASKLRGQIEEYEFAHEQTDQTV